MVIFNIPIPVRYTAISQCRAHLLLWVIIQPFGSLQDENIILKLDVDNPVHTARREQIDDAHASRVRSCSHAVNRHNILFD
jgi:hypothetical protein